MSRRSPLGTQKTTLSASLGCPGSATTRLCSTTTGCQQISWLDSGPR